MRGIGIFFLIFMLSMRGLWAQNTSDSLAPYGDLDHDGVVNKYDVCPDAPGTAENTGCPERVLVMPGPYATGELARYLPYADYDRDGIPNHKDRCPTLPGLIKGAGCPSHQDSQDSLNYQLIQTDTLYFTQGNIFLRPTTRKQINRLLIETQKREHFQLTIVAPIFPPEGGQGIHFAKKRIQQLTLDLGESGISPSQILADLSPTLEKESRKPYLIIKLLAE